MDRAVVSFLATAWTNASLWSEDGAVFKEFSENSLSWACQNVESAVKKGKSLLS